MDLCRRHGRGGNNARFCLSEVKLGIIPAVISPYVVRAIGARQANRYFMTAEVIPADWAQALGIAHEVVAEAELDSAVARLVEALSGGPAAQIACRDLIARVSDGAIDEAMLEDTAARIARLRTSAEGQEGLSASGKRSPNWITRFPQKRRWRRDQPTPGITPPATRLQPQIGITMATIKNC